MQEILNNFFFTRQFIPHGHCYLWQPGLVWLHVVSDSLIALAYYSIPITLVYFVRKRRDIPFDWVFLLFGAFIVFCGTTHILEVWTLWHPFYWLSGFIKAITAIVSLYTTAALVSLLPLAIALPSPAQIEATNRELSNQIIERQQVEQAVEKQAQALQDQAQLLDLAHDTIVVRSLDSIITFWNNGAEEMYGWKKEEALGKNSHSLLQTEFPQPLPEIKAALLQEGRWEGEVVHTKRDGTRAIVASRWTLKRDELGQPLAVLEINYDITLAKRTEELLRETLDQLEIRVQERTAELTKINESLQAEIAERQRIESVLWESEAQYLRLIETAAEGIWILDAEGKTTFANAKMAQMLGYTLDEMMGVPLSAFMNAEGQAIAANNLERHNQGTTEQHDFKFRRKDGSDLWALISTNPILDADKQYVGALEMITDITDRKLAEEALKESEARLKLAIDWAQMGLWNLDLITGTITESEHVGPMFGLPLGAVNRDLESWQKHIHPDDFERVIREFEDAIAGLSDYDTQYRAIGVDGKVRWIAASGRILRDAVGIPVSIVGIAFDVTKEKETEQEREQLLVAERQVRAEAEASEQRYRFLGETIPQIVWTANPDGYVEYCNSRWYDYTGITPEQTLGWGWESVLHPDDVPKCKELWSQAVETGNRYQIEYRFKRASDGQYRWHLGRALPMRNKEGDIVHWFGTCTDIDDQKRVESQIKASLTEKEVLLKEIHHRVKNNLQIISSLLNLQVENLKDEQAVGIFKVSQNRIESMALIHEKLYQSKDLARINFADYIRDLVASLFCAYEVNSEAIALKLYIDDVFLGIDAAIPCGLILNELVLNSLKYAFPAGKAGEICVALYSENTNNFQLIVRDNGIGLPPNFDFRNTESLGLQLVDTLTNQLEGTIELDTTKGVEFKITFSA